MTAEVDVRESQVEPDPYTEIAKRLFNEFLEMLIALRTQGGVTPEEQTKKEKVYAREVKSWREANQELKLVAKQLTEENERLSTELDAVALERDNLRLRLNQAIINQQTVARRIDHASREYPLDQAMSERAFAEWRKIMQELPSLRGEDEDA